MPETKNGAPAINLDIDKIFEENRDLLEDTLTSEIKERIKSKIKYDLGLGTIIEDWMQENVAPAVIKYFDDNKEKIIKQYLSAYEKAINEGIEKRAEEMVKKSTGYSFQKALQEL